MVSWWRCLAYHYSGHHHIGVPVTNGDTPSDKQPADTEQTVADTAADSQPAAANGNGAQQQQAAVEEAPHQGGSNGNAHTNGKTSEAATKGKEPEQKNEEFTCCESVLE